MNNPEKELNSYLLDMEREVLALKTAHQRPLGALNFFKDNLNFNVNLTESFGVYGADIEVIVNIARPSVTPPIVQAGWDTPSGFYTVNFRDFNTSADYSTWTYQLQLLSETVSSTTMKFGVLSSQPINSIIWRYI